MIPRKQSQSNWPQTLVTRGPVTATTEVAPGEMLLVDTSAGAFTVNLPDAPPINTICGVQKADTSRNALTITAPGGAVVEDPYSGISSTDNTTIIIAKEGNASWVYDGAGRWHCRAMVKMGGYLEAFQGTPITNVAQSPGQLINWTFQPINPAFPSSNLVTHSAGVFTLLEDTTVDISLSAYCQYVLPSNNDGSQVAFQGQLTSPGGGVLFLPIASAGESAARAGTNAYSVSTNGIISAFKNDTFQINAVASNLSAGTADLLNAALILRSLY